VHLVSTRVGNAATSRNRTFFLVGWRNSSRRRPLFSQARSSRLFDACRVSEVTCHCFAKVGAEGFCGFCPTNVFLKMSLLVRNVEGTRRLLCAVVGPRLGELDIMIGVLVVDSFVDVWNPRGGLQEPTTLACG
jgi:hypothetical protein